MQVAHRPVPKRICLALFLATIVVYARTFGYGFVAYDDDQYIYNNPLIYQGLTGSTFGWALTTFACGNWHPLTWISFLTESSVFGVKPQGFHVVNVLLHGGCAVLLFLALDRMTRRRWASATVAAIFAFHPLHVESVAWIAERKDVLSTFLEMAALWLYARHVERPSTGRYLTMAAVFGLGLMAKPMLVTFPFLLLLLDYWPLQRLRRRAWMEKAPLIVMSVAASFVTLAAQRQGGAIVSPDRMSFGWRIANAAVSYVVYLREAVAPFDLGALYPVSRPGVAATIAAVLVLGLLTAVVVRYRRSRPYLLTGWLWHLGALAPVIGIIQVGEQAHADRYMYVPLIGLSLAVTWGVADWLQTREGLRRPAIAATVAVLAAFAGLSWRQSGFWRDSRTLFAHTISVTTDNPIMHNNLGAVLSREGDAAGAVAQYRKAVALFPDFADARANLGHELLRAGQPDAAQPEILQAIRLKPGSALPYIDLAKLAVRKARKEEAVRYVGYALRLGSGNPEVHGGACEAYLALGQKDNAATQCREALRLKPDYTEARRTLERVYSPWSSASSADRSRTRIDRPSTFNSPSC